MWKLFHKVCAGSPSTCKDMDSFYSSFSLKPTNDNGTQAFVGFLISKYDKRMKCFFKISRCEDNTVLHEYRILRSLQSIADKCPHFNRIYGIINYKSGADPSVCPKTLSDGEAKFERNMLLLEYVPHVTNLFEFIEIAPPHIMISLIRQILMVVRIMRHSRICHNDLHPENILIRSCPKNLILKYTFGIKVFNIHTRGFIVTLVDFGYGSSESAADSTLLGSYEFSHYGYFTEGFSPYVDYLRIFCTLNYLLKKSRNINHRRARKYFYNFISEFKYIDTSNGRDKGIVKKSLVEYVYKGFDNSEFFNSSVLFEDSSWISILQNLINSPLQEVVDAVGDPTKYFTEFLEEWLKFEERISSQSTLRHLFKLLVLCVRDVREEYLANPESAASAKFKEAFLRKYCKIITFHCPAINFEKILYSLILCGAYLENRMYEYMQKILKIKGVEQMVGNKFNTKTCDDYLWNRFNNIFPEKGSDLGTVYYYSMKY